MIARPRAAFVVGALVVLVALGVLPAAAPAAATMKEFCAAYKPFNLLYAEQFERGVPSDEQVAAVDDRMDTLATRAEQAAPRRIAADMKLVADAFHAGLSTVIAAVVEGDADLANAFFAVDTYALDSCDYRVLDVTAVDGGFRGVPDTLKPGFVAFAFSNDTDQDHLVMVVRLKGSTTPDELAPTFDDLLRQVEVIAPPATAPPGLRVASYARITKPGRYAVLDPTFLVDGMVTEFRVPRPAR